MARVFIMAAATSLLRLLLLLAITAPLTLAQTFRNPVIYSDYPDNDISRGPDGAYYFSASNFHFSPGAPILRSFDLINWEPIGHSIPRLTFGDGYDLVPGQHAYRGGTWASTLRYRESNGLWYWIGCTNFWVTWVFTAPDVSGPWQNRGPFNWDGLCMYDNGLLIDDDDTMYVVYGNGQIKVSQLSPDGLSVVRTEQVLQASDVNTETVEGNRMYKINGTYYILNDQPGSTTYIWKSASPWGPYESKILVQNVVPPLEGGNSPHQGSLVETKDGRWYFMSFTWAYPAGRMPVLAPVTWGADGFPVLTTGSNGGWGETYPLPLPERPVYNWTEPKTYDFRNGLGPTWEWNHNPDIAAFSTGWDGLTLRTATVTTDLYRARNTLTHRMYGEFPTATVEIEFGGMADGDRFGLAAFRDQSAFISVTREGGDYRLSVWHGLIINEWDGNPVSPGNEVGTATVPAGKRTVWLRAELDARPGATGTRDAFFSYSFDGVGFTRLGPAYKLYDGWAFFVAYRFAVFNFATRMLGGEVKVKSFTAA